MNKNEQDRLTAVEIDTKMIKSDIATIKNNHLKHIESSMGSMDKRIEKIDMRIWSVVFGIITLLATTLLANFF